MTPDPVREHAEAERDRALNALRSLLAYVSRVGGYMSAEDQLVLQEARAVLAESGW
jgi:hypothetical protein